MGWVPGFDNLTVTVFCRVRFLVGNSATDLASLPSLEKMGFWKGIVQVTVISQQCQDEYITTVFSRARGASRALTHEGLWWH